MANRVFTQTFGVVGAIIERDGKILLVKESQKKGPDEGKWNHPAGWIEVGEDPTGVLREIEEETGFSFTPIHILGIYSLIRKDLEKQLGQIHHPVKIIFIGTISDKRVADLADDVSETKWFTPEEIEAMDSKTLRDMDIKQMVKDYFSGKRYPLDLLTHTMQE
ncbi:NUDIX domain-containing protein [Patescibacteria group bacterium]|nr:NUDIX domain-containing protein [Patescibacteria group bacterium]